MKKSTLALASLAVLTASSASFATEGGGSSYPIGAENHLAGAAPPPGVYLLEYVNQYSATSLLDGQGRAVPVPGFKVKATALVSRVVWVTNTPALGGKWWPTPSFRWSRSGSTRAASRPPIPGWAT